MSKKNKGEKKYKAQYWDPITEKRIYLGYYTTREQADQAQEQYIQDLEEIEEEPVDTGLTVLDLCNLYGDYMKANNVEGTYKRYISFMRQLHLYGLTVYPVNELPPIVVNQYIEQRKTKQQRDYGLGMRTVGGLTAAKYDFKTLKAVYKWGHNLELCDHDPTSGVRPFSADINERYVPSTEDLNKVISLAKPHDREYLTMLKLTGARPIEIKRAKFDDIDWNKLTITLWSRKKTHGKRAPRSVPLHPELVGILKRRQTEVIPTNKEGFIFWHSVRGCTGHYEGPFVQKYKFLVDLCKRAGVKRFTPYSIRHWFATKLAIRAGDEYSIYDVSKILGHDDIKTTMVYLHSQDKERRKAIETLT